MLQLLPSNYPEQQLVIRTEMATAGQSVLKKHHKPLVPA